MCGKVARVALLRRRCGFCWCWGGLWLELCGWRCVAVSVFSYLVPIVSAAWFELSLSYWRVSGVSKRLQGVCGGRRTSPCRLSSCW